jgi:hypothetical protein
MLDIQERVPQKWLDSRDYKPLGEIAGRAEKFKNPNSKPRADFQPSPKRIMHNIYYQHMF